jgi:hypothetical protein
MRALKHTIYFVFIIFLILRTCYMSVVVMESAMHVIVEERVYKKYSIGCYLRK